MSPIPEQLPPCEGPKLKKFPYHNSTIQWLERLDENREDDDVTSSQGYVFKARIGSREYAVKVFKFFDPMSTEYAWGPQLGEDTSLDTAAYYTDPFYAECRAYGQIREAIEKNILKKDVAVPCHGFFFLKNKDQETLQNRNIDLGLDLVDMDYQRSAIGGRRARAIVKDLASSNSGITSTTIRKILSKVVLMNKAGIYNMDIRIGNFCDGQLVDFGSSWTEPHALLASLSREAAAETAERLKRYIACDLGHTDDNGDGDMSHLTCGVLRHLYSTLLISVLVEIEISRQRSMKLVASHN
ncbi:kinetochore Sim4 complex subunit FTA2-domain-containing protein [Fusarium oxysporum f. sp. albedinis]|nr:kinetochore Sim4 complex subunit FTA2-domain-containing protein [Fusarium oxysporum f. sp. albedinis]